MCLCLSVGGLNEKEPVCQHLSPVKFQQESKLLTLIVLEHFFFFTLCQNRTFNKTAGLSNMTARLSLSFFFVLQEVL